MAEITEYEDYEEFYAKFIRIEGKRGVVLIFVDDLESDRRLASEIAEILDK